MRDLPVIGITVGYREDDRPTCSLPVTYVDSVVLAGGLPLLLPPVKDDRVIDKLLERVSGVLFTGGPDVDPAAYGQEPHPKTQPLHPRRSNFELALVRLAVGRGLPVMGICLGCQMINVALRGSLHQHLPDHVTSPLPHSPDEAGKRTYHRVTIDPDSRLAGIVGATELEANSSHHQSIRSVSPELRAVAWSEDGVIEGAEAVDDRFILAIQWHPENLAAERAQHLALFRALVEAARRSAVTDPEA